MNPVGQFGTGLIPVSIDLTLLRETLLIAYRG